MEKGNELLQLELVPGKPCTINNPNPANLRFELATIGGTRIVFALPSGAKFEITPGNDIRSATLVIEDFTDYGPRPVD